MPTTGDALQVGVALIHESA